MTANPAATAPTCEVCRQPLVERVVTCSRCDTPHHRECFEYNGQCATYACGSREAGALTVQAAVDEVEIRGPHKELESELALELDGARRALEAGNTTACRMVLEKALAQGLAEGDAGVEAWALLGAMRVIAGDHSSALDAFDRAQALGCLGLPGLINRAVALHRLGRLGESLDLLRAVERRLPKLSKNSQFIAWYRRALVEVGLERHVDALMSLDCALALKPGDPEALTIRAVTKDTMRRRHQARERGQRNR